MIHLILSSLIAFTSQGHLASKDKNTEVWFYVFSNEHNKVFGPSHPDGGNAVKCWEHPAWTAKIPGAEWIWDSYRVLQPDGEETAEFLNDFVVEGEIISAYLEIAADNSVWVKINGQETDCVKDGGSFTIDSQFGCDVTKYVEVDLNDIEFKVVNLPLQGGAEANPAGLLYKLTIKTLV